MRRIHRGDIYFIKAGDNGGATGAEIRPGRPGVIVSNDKNNRFSPTVEIVYLTTRCDKKRLPVHVLIDSAPKPSVALCEQITTVDKSRLLRYQGAVSKAEMAAITDACHLSISEHCSPGGGAGHA